MTYRNYSGGAEGADKEWDRIGREYGFEKHIHFRPSHLKEMNQDQRDTMEDDVFHAAKGLGRPTGDFPGKDLIRRNWLQMFNADAIFAVSRIINPGEKDKGFINNTGKQNVSGGTAWACEMAIQKGKPVHVFDMSTNKWYLWKVDKFVEETTPILTERYAGIGSRNLTPEGTQAIHNVYKLTRDARESKDGSSD